jgi:hypothetical protein
VATDLPPGDLQDGGLLPNPTNVIVTLTPFGSGPLEAQKVIGTRPVGL